MKEFTLRLDSDDMRLIVSGIVGLTDGLRDMFHLKARCFEKHEIQKWFYENYDTLAGAIMIINQNMALLEQYLDSETLDES